jgi:hypothetical protein
MVSLVIDRFSFIVSPILFLHRQSSPVTGDFVTVRFLDEALLVFGKIFDEAMRSVDFLAK